MDKSPEHRVDREDTQLANNHVKGCSISDVIKELLSQNNKKPLHKY